jgi:hypothetical protein
LQPTQYLKNDSSAAKSINSPIRSLDTRCATGIKEAIRIIRQKKNPILAAKTFGAALTMAGGRFSALFTERLAKRMGLNFCCKNARIKKSMSKKAIKTLLGAMTKTSPIMNTKKAFSLTTFSLTISREIGQHSFIETPGKLIDRGSL